MCRQRMKRSLGNNNQWAFKYGAQKEFGMREDDEMFVFRKEISD